MNKTKRLYRLLRAHCVDDIMALRYNILERMKRIWGDKARDDDLYWQPHDKQMLKRHNMLIRNAERTPFGESGKPEPLRGDLSGFWSRRIDGEHRLVYRAANGVWKIPGVSRKEDSP